jgi:hypothetical protein
MVIIIITTIIPKISPSPTDGHGHDSVPCGYFVHRSKVLMITIVPGGYNSHLGSSKI